MDRKIKIGSFCVLCSALLFFTQSLLACFTVVVGKDASYNGSVLVGHDEQNSGNLFVNFRKIPEISYQKGSMIELKNGGKIPQVSRTNSFLWSEIPSATSSDGYMNEYGVAIVSDFCPDRMPDIETLEKEGQIKDQGLSYLLRRLIIERAKNAREGVEVAGQLIDKYGYTSNRTFVIADPNEAWLMAVTKGNKWVAERVKDDEVALLPNVYTILKVDPKDTKNFILSKDLIKYAEKKGWYNPAKDKYFNFSAAYSEPREQLMDPRQWLAQEIVTQKRVSRIPDRRLPFSIKPAQKMTIQDIMAVLRNTNTDNYMNKLYDVTLINGKKQDPENWKWRNICLRRTQVGSVFELNSKLPPAIGCIYWSTSAAPNTSILLPWYVGIIKTPSAYYYKGILKKVLTSKYHFDTNSYSYQPNYSKAWWIFRKLQAQLDQGSISNVADVRKVWDKEENILIKKQPEIQKKAIELYSKDKNSAYKYLTKYCADVAAKAIKEAKSFTKKYPEYNGNPNNVVDPGVEPAQVCPVPGGETSTEATG